MQNQENVKDNQTLDLSILDSVLFPEKPEKEIDPNEDKFIIYKQQIDTHTIKAKRVKLTPAVCDKCGLDLLNLAFSQNKIAVNDFNQLSPDLKLLMTQLVSKHKQQKHSISEELIIAGSNVSTEWLSGMTRE